MVNSLIGGHTSNYGIMLNIQTWGISLCETLSVTNNIVSFFIKGCRMFKKETGGE